MPASHISDALGIAPSSLSFHLKELVHAGLLQARQDGRFIVYSAHFDTMHGLVAFLTDNCCGGAPCPPGAPTCQEGSCS